MKNIDTANNTHMYIKRKIYFVLVELILILYSSNFLLCILLEFQKSMIIKKKKFIIIKGEKIMEMTEKIKVKVYFFISL